MNAAHNIVDCLESIQKSTYRSFEVIVVDGRSQDGTAEIARDMGVRVIEGKAGGRASDCNLGIVEARGEIIVLTDDDCVVDEHWLERIVESFSDPRVGISGGPDLTYLPGTTNVGLAAGYIHYFYRSLASETGTDAVIGCNSAYRKKALAEVGSFDEGYPGAEDTSLHRRIMDQGYTMRPHRQAIVYHKRRADFRTLVKRYWTYGWHMGLAHRRNPRAFKERSKHIYALLGGLLALLLLVAASVIFPVVAWSFFGLAVVYLIFQGWLYRKIARETGFRSPFLLFLISSTVCMLFFGLAFTREQVFPGRKKM